MADRICAWKAEGKTLRSFCLLEDTPKLQTVYNWQDAHPDFFEKYARATDRGMDLLAELAVDEASISSLPPERVQAARLAFDARRWYTSKIAPRRYGDKLDLRAEITGAGGGPITFAVLLSQAIERPEVVELFDDEELMFLQQRIVPKLLAAPASAAGSGAPCAGSGEVIDVTPSEVPAED
jgi:hypothetical protein